MQPDLVSILHSHICMKPHCGCFAPPHRNPIHTDRAAALAAGLPDIILHGTATMAKAVTAIVSKYGVDGGEDAPQPSTVWRTAVKTFSAVVLMPSITTLRILAVESAGSDVVGTEYHPCGEFRVVHYDVLNAQGQHAIKGGVVVFGPPLEVTVPSARNPDSKSRL